MPRSKYTTDANGIQPSFIDVDSSPIDSSGKQCICWNSVPNPLNSPVAGLAEHSFHECCIALQSENRQERPHQSVEIRQHLACPAKENCHTSNPATKLDVHSIENECAKYCVEISFEIIYHISVVVEKLTSNM